MLTSITSVLRVARRRMRVAQRRRLVELADATVGGLVLVEDGVVLAVNRALRELTGRDGDAPALAELFPDPRAQAFLAQPDAARLETVVLGADGGPVPVELTVTALRPAGLCAVAVRDLSERRAAEGRIAFLARHDPLTGLLHRASFQERLQAQLEHARRRAERLVVVRLDLDGLGAVNAAFGPEGGDRALCEAAERIASILDPDTSLARLGGAQFALLVPRGLERRALDRLCLAIIGVIRPPVALEDGRSATLAVNLGAAVFPYDGAALLDKATQALAEAQRSGPNSHRLFDAELAAGLRDREVLGEEIAQALAEGQFALVYQPQVRAIDGQVRGFEALARWNHPGRGLIGPEVFIPIAEQTGHIFALGEQILRQACAAAQEWSDHLSVSVNLSAVQLLTPGLAQQVLDVLNETDLAPGRLELEVTEAALARDPGRALEVLQELKALGCRIAMDDFGAGLSSLGNLRLFPIDRIKIDPMFVRDIHRDAKSAAVVRSMLALGHGLGLEVVAEGVEEAAQLDALRREACDSVQGYLLGRPGDVASCYRPGCNTIRFPLERRFAAAS